MAKITRAQFEKWNAQGQNGFAFDLQHFLVWGEKRLHKIIPQENGDKLEVVLDYRPEYKRHTNEHGCSWNTETGRHIPYMSVTRWCPSGTDGVHISHGFSERENVGEISEKKNYAYLCKLSGTVNTDEAIRAFLAA